VTRSRRDGRQGTPPVQVDGSCRSAECRTSEAAHNMSKRDAIRLRPTHCARKHARYSTLARHAERLSPITAAQ
jgi:hypothetical protein